MAIEFVEDQESFDRHQIAFLRELIATAKSAFRQANVEVAEDDFYELLSVMSFNISALLDASATAGPLDDPTVPFLAFRKDERSEIIITSPVGSYLHEISEGVLEEVFDEDDETEPHE
jgi:hypothetical protein